LPWVADSPPSGTTIILVGLEYRLHCFTRYADLARRARCCTDPVLVAENERRHTLQSSICTLGRLTVVESITRDMPSGRDPEVDFTGAIVWGSAAGVPSEPVVRNMPDPHSDCEGIACI
jgi:hypothetical protein